MIASSASTESPAGPRSGLFAPYFSWLQYLQDSQVLQRAAKNTLQYMEFKLLLAEELTQGQTCQQDMNDSSDEEFTLEIKKKKPHPDERIRKYGAVHLPEMVNSPRPFRCRMPGCNSKMYTRCVKCYMSLCVFKNGKKKKKYSASSYIINDWTCVK